MNSKDFRLGNYLRKKGEKEQQKITGLHHKFVILGDGALLEWNEVEPIPIMGVDIEFIFREYGYAVNDCQYLHEAQNKIYAASKIELYEPKKEVVDETV